MKQTRKQILGLAGLAAVMAMTTAVFALPSGEVAAEEAGSVNFRVSVGEATTSANFSSPQDGAALTDPNLQVNINYSEASRLQYILHYTDASGATQEVIVRDIQTGTVSGSDGFILDLSQYGYGKYSLTVRAYKDNSTTGAYHEDTVNFTYGAINIPPEDNAVSFIEGENPVIRAEISDNVNKVQVQVYDKSGKAMFVDASGKETPLLVDRSHIDPNTGQLLVELPFMEYGIAPGDYTAVLAAYDRDGKFLDMATYNLSYVAKSVDPNHPDQPGQPGTVTPNTPNTGSTKEGLTLSRIDYFLTGLVVFAAVSGFACFMIYRHKRTLWK